MAKKPKYQPKACCECRSEDAVRGEKYCSGCRKAVLAMLKADGYLEDSKPPTMFSDERGRKSNNWTVFGGAPKAGTDGDDW